MYAIEFEASVKNGMIKIPDEYKIPDLQNLRIIVLAPEGTGQIPQSKDVYTDEYIEKNWKELTSKGLSSCNDKYYKSEQYKLDRGAYLMEKYK